MSDPVTVLGTRIAYAARQLPRLAWFAGHGVVMRRLQARVRRSAPRSGAPPERHAATGPAPAPLPGSRRLYADLAGLLRQDLANVEAGIYPVPDDHDGSLATLLERSRLFFTDLPAIHARRERNGFRDVLAEAPRRGRPAYYLQNFHFQSGGWMTEDSAERYDTQVEVLFNGTANAMRRQALVPLHEVFAGRDQRRLRLIDIGCGTGRFLDCLKQAWPRLPALGLDLSEAYVRHARRHLRRWGKLAVAVGNAEAIPAAEASVDAVTSVFMMHELPAKVRRVVIAECARVLKPGGRLVLVDSLQRGDDPDYDGLLERFPQNYHEPYYAGYLDEDFSAMAAGCGLVHVRDVNAFVSKVMVFDKAQ
ncbi:class I SAM-dependent methyltransferase [Rhodoplanes roseus]|uniref:Methyltransferase domain-containing protein n=1 Tax=Rhodoplanes roseus TaxID=29409 RepID=A0A327L1M3_9BRAD|nr:class I SAM-dependent methyltransferase [Rhodoplanes roseus]RAI44980.1 hypothetical protein CH341_06405 [Rhodoplanes roseus]